MPDHGKDYAIGQMLSAAEIEAQRKRNASIPVDEHVAGASAPLPKYRCHKEVWALKLGGVGPNDLDGSAFLYPTDEGYAPFRVDKDYMQKHKPFVGGYYVVYKDGYKSFSPAEAFEEGYSRV